MKVKETIWTYMDITKCLAGFQIENNICLSKKVYKFWYTLASFLGLSYLQFLIACSIETVSDKKLELGTRLSTRIALLPG